MIYSKVGTVMTVDQQACVDLVALLAARKQTVAVAESLTGGLLAAAFVQVPGASQVFRGGVCTYATQTKHSVLGVSAEQLALTGPVAPEVAQQMAVGVRRLMGANFGLATTGVAGPGPSGGHPAGTVFIACTWADDARVVPLALSGDREQVRAGTVANILALFGQVLRRLT